MNFIELARKLALSDLEDESSLQLRRNYIFSVVCVRANGSVALSKNILTRTPNPNAHAEKRVLAKSGYGATLYVVRLTREGIWAMAKPCKACSTLIKNKKVKKVVYTLGNNELGTWYPNE